MEIALANALQFKNTLEGLNPDIEVSYNYMWTFGYDVKYKGEKIAFYHLDDNGIVEDIKDGAELLGEDLYLGTVEQIVVCIMRHVFDIK